jgi:hypothetical protein
VTEITQGHRVADNARWYDLEATRRDEPKTWHGYLEHGVWRSV